GPQGPFAEGLTRHHTRAPRRAAEARRLHARLHDDPEEAELGAPEGRPCAPDEPDGGLGLHPRRGAQPAGALGGARAWRSRPRPPGRALQGDPRRARRGRRRRPPPGPVQVRREDAKVMPRRAVITRRPIEPDPVYNSALVTQL